MKGNIGHLESASALASFVKVVQYLEKASILAQLQFVTPTPAIDFRGVHIPKLTILWASTSGEPRRAAINIFGAGGTNGRAVLESFDSSQRKKSTEGSRPYLFKVSAIDNVSLSANSLAHSGYTEKTRPDLQDLAHTLLCRRSNMRKSRFFSASNHDEAVMSFQGGSHGAILTDSDSSKRVVFVFTGQGAQWPQMGQSLAQHSPLFRAVLEECDHQLALLLDPPCWSLYTELAKAKDLTNIYKAEFSQPLCTALQLGIITLLNFWGLKADAVVGHSSGEIAAAYASGRISMRDAITIAYYRGFALSQVGCKSQGSMCAVKMGEQDAFALPESLEGRVQVAAVNSAASCTLSGDSASITKIMERMKESRQSCRQLRVDQGGFQCVLCHIRLTVFQPIIRITCCFWLRHTWQDLKLPT